MLTTFKNSRVLANHLILSITGDGLKGRVDILNIPLRIGNNNNIIGLLNCSN